MIEHVRAHAEAKAQPTAATGGVAPPKTSFAAMHAAAVARVEARRVPGAAGQAGGASPPRAAAAPARVEARQVPGAAGQAGGASPPRAAAAPTRSSSAAAAVGGVAPPAVGARPAPSRGPDAGSVGGVAPPSSPTTSTPEHHAPPPVPPTGETWEAVRGVRNYAKIASGPRAGQYIDLGRGARHGTTFSIERRDGRDVHVYGSGTHEQVVDAAADARHAIARPTRTMRGVDPAKDQPPKGETWAPVPGHLDYADILGGPRNGLYVNTSGNARTGMAFQIVREHGQVLHVYGEGDHQLVIHAGHYREHPHRRPAPQPRREKPLTAGGVAA